MIERWLWMWNYRKPIIAQTHGYCLSGGLDLIGACDIVFAAEGTLFGHPAARGMGIPVTLGMLPIKVGAAATKELLFTGDLIDADEARELGLVRRVLPPDELDDYTLAFCQRVAMNPLDGLTVHKHVTNRWLEVMGIRLAAMEGAEFDAIFHLTPSMKEFGRLHARRRPARRAGLARRSVRHRPARRPRRGDPPAPLTWPTSVARSGSCTRRTSTSATPSTTRASIAPLVDAAIAPRRRPACCSSATSSTTTGCRPRSARRSSTSWPPRRPGRRPARGTTTASCPTPSGGASSCPANVHVMTDAAGEHVELADLDIALWGRPHPDYGDLRPLAGIPAPRRAPLARRPRPRTPGAAARRPPPRLPDHARGDRRVGAGLHRPRPLGRPPRHERRRRHGPLLGLGEPLRRLRPGDADRRSDGDRRVDVERVELG